MEKYDELMKKFKEDYFKKFVIQEYEQTRAFLDKKEEKIDDLYKGKTRIKKL